MNSFADENQIENVYIEFDLLAVSKAFWKVRTTGSRLSIYSMKISLVSYASSQAGAAAGKATKGIIFRFVRFEFMPTKCQMLIDFAAIKIEPTKKTLSQPRSTDSGQSLSLSLLLTTPVRACIINMAFVERAGWEMSAWLGLAWLARRKQHISGSSARTRRHYHKLNIAANINLIVLAERTNWDRCTMARRLHFTTTSPRQKTG